MKKERIMKKRIRGIKWFAIIFIIIFIIICMLIGALGYGAKYAFERAVEISYMLRPLDGENRSVRNKITGFYAEPDDSMDIVVVGSSAVYRYVNNPLLWEEQGLTSYNFCTPGLSIFTLEIMIDEVLKTQSPELIIVDARKFLLTDDEELKEERFVQLVNSLNYSQNRRDLIDMFVDDEKQRLKWYVDASLYYKNWENLPEDAEEYADNKKLSELKGWANKVAAVEIGEIDVADITDELPLAEVSESCLKKLMNYCKDRNVEVLFLATPWKCKDDYQKESNYMKRVVEEYGFHYLDMNLLVDEIGIDEKNDFYNTRHANSLGASKVTHYLGKYLMNHYEFDTTHSEEIKESWDFAYQLSSDTLNRMIEKKRNKLTQN